jgi:aarF domain-containing kinase
MATVTAPPSSLPFIRAATTSSSKKKKKNHQKQRALGNFGHFGQVVRKDMDFLKRGFNNGVAWANDAFRIPQIAKKIDDLVWLRNLEDPVATSFSTPTWPEPWYPGKIGTKKLVFCLWVVVIYA